MTSPLINITIPTYNRADTCLGRAIDAALTQTYMPTTVTVIDDGSVDNTARLLRSYASEPRFSAIRLGKNLGTAQAKNLSILCSRYDAITFHDSDDVPTASKVLLQSRALNLDGHCADDILDWSAFGYEAGCQLEVDVVVGAYELIKMDGSVHYINKRISLVDDFFPNLQFPSKTEGDWCLINAGLFRRRVFETLGGYLDSIEEDRELRNRTIAHGCVYYFIDRSLLTKIEMTDSLTIEADTGFKAEKRRSDRAEVWQRNQRYRCGLLGSDVARVDRVEIDLGDAIIEEVVNSGNLTYQSAIPATDETRELLSDLAEPPAITFASAIAPAS